MVERIYLFIIFQKKKNNVSISGDFTLVSEAAVCNHF